jgi:nucleotide-binding universal stress UspA family protein
MFENLVVPVDLSTASLEAIPIAARMAAAVDGRVTVVHVVDHLDRELLARDILDRAVERLGPQPTDVEVLVCTDRSVSDRLARHVEDHPGSMLLLRSHGHGRSAAILGTTVDELLRAMFGPLIVIGPNATASSGALDGTYVVPLDGSTRAEGVIPIAAAWAVEFNGSPCLVEVLDRGVASGSDPMESSYVCAQASTLDERIDRPVEFEVLHDKDAAGAIVEFATEQHASLIFIATHGRTGLERLRTGSVAADIVRHSPAPVVMFRPPELRRPVHSPESDATAAV